MENKIVALYIPFRDITDLAIPMLREHGYSPMEIHTNPSEIADCLEATGIKRVIIQTHPTRDDAKGHLDEIAQKVDRLIIIGRDGYDAVALAERHRQKVKIVDLLKYDDLTESALEPNAPDQESVKAN